MSLRIEVDQERLAEFCRRHHIKTLAFFGSVLRDDFRPDSDVDVLVDFDPDGHVSLLDMIRMERELGELLGRETDLVSKAGLNPLIHDEVISGSEVIYAA